MTPAGVDTLYLRLLGTLLLGAILGCATADEVVLCGDGVMGSGELCDDGNADDGDGCDQRCAIEVGFLCEGLPSTCGPVCGDAMATGGEACDGEDLAGNSCEALGLGAGPLSCTGSCELDTSACLALSCGNGQLDGVEQCESSNVGAATCVSEGFDAGELACSAGCQLDTSNCKRFSCGNGTVDGADECDDQNNTSGDGCSANCAIEAGWQCSGQPSDCTELCGNGLVDEGEQCDLASLGGQSCVGLSFDYGTLACEHDCTYNTSGCSTFTCGDGMVTGAETCDGANLDGATCASVGNFIGGTLLCSNTCGYDVSGCTPVKCGDGIVSPGEACDDNNEVSGDGCNVICNIEANWVCSGEPSSCSPLCGNAILDGGEDCDGPLLGDGTCSALGFDFGDLDCDADCKFDTSDCSTFSCGDGFVTGVEKCDGADLAGHTCQQVGAFVGGTLACTGQCAFDVAGCIPVQCGDGIISPGEKCDDNNPASGDGCNAACQVENGWLCSGEPSICVPSCGNGVVDAGEDCDGLNLNAESCVTRGFPGGMLACNASCDFDTSACLANVCGNNVVEVNEDCDDGNTASGDGCSGSCQWEAVCTADESIACGGFDGDQALGNEINSYSCGGFGGGPERIYAFTAPAGTTSVTVTLDCEPTADDYDLYLLEDTCNPNICLAHDTLAGCGDTVFAVIPGVHYFIVVEEYFAAYTYNISLACN